MVDARAQIIDFFQGHVDIAGQLFGRALHAVAQANRLDGRGAVDGPAVHGHGVDVLQKGHVRAQFFHIRAHLQQHGNGAQAAHDAANAQRVGNGLAQAILLGHFKVHHRARLVACHLEHANGVVGAIQGGAAVQGGLDGGLHAQRLGDLVGHDGGSAQPLFVNVVQADGRIGQFGKCQDVANEVFGKYGAARTDEGDFGHRVLLKW